MSGRVIAIAEIEGDHISRQVEYWPVASPPPPGREELTGPIPPVP